MIARATTRVGCGGYGGGEHAFTLLLTDRVTQWTEPRAVLNKAQKWVFQELLQVRSWLPFVLVGSGRYSPSVSTNQSICRSNTCHTTYSCTPLRR